MTGVGGWAGGGGVWLPSCLTQLPATLRPASAPYIVLEHTVRMLSMHRLPLPLCRMERMVVEMLSNKADASVLAQSAAAAEAEAKQLRKDKAAQQQLLEARGAEVLKLQVRWVLQGCDTQQADPFISFLAGPSPASWCPKARPTSHPASPPPCHPRNLQARLQEVESPEQTAKAERLAALLEEKAGMLGAAARREAAAQQERDAAQYLARWCLQAAAISRTNWHLCGCLPCQPAWFMLAALTHPLLLHALLRAGQSG